MHAYEFRPPLPKVSDDEVKAEYEKEKMTTALRERVRIMSGQFSPSG